MYSTFLGGNGGDRGLGIARDGSGNAYVTGSAGSLDFPLVTEAAKSATGPYTEAFVSKFNAASTALVYSTFVGGSGNDTGRAIAVDATGAAYLAGQTNSSDFPVSVVVTTDCGLRRTDRFPQFPGYVHHRRRLPV